MGKIKQLLDDGNFKPLNDAERKKMDKAKARIRAILK
jgi:hypothetical protein